MKEFILFELSRRLTHLIETAPSSNNDLRSQAVEAVKTSIDASVNNLLEVNGIEIPEDPKRQAIEHVTNTTPSDNLENLMNGLHNLIVFQANSSSFQVIMDFVNQIPPGGHVDDFYLFQTELGEARSKLELETPYFVSFPFFISFLEQEAGMK